MDKQIIELTELNEQIKMAIQKVENISKKHKELQEKFKAKEQECEELKADLFGGIEFVENAKNGICKDNPNCYYKNWQRAEQRIVELNKTIQAKEQECEELKRGLNLILTVQKNCKECPHQKLDVDVLVCDLDCATAFKKIAKQTLKKLENKNV